jgi:predicted nucleotidyltransferase
LTHETIRNALGEVSSPIYGKDSDIYLQGSYVNDTNVRGESDVDVVVQLNSSWFPDISGLTQEEQQLYRSFYQNATYTDRARERAQERSTVVEEGSEKDIEDSQARSKRTVKNTYF